MNAASVDTTTYDPKAIANFFIERAAADGKRLTPLQLIKLVYIAHGWYLGLTGGPLINEPPEAWQYGPVIPSLYHSLKVYGNGPITEKLYDFDVSPKGTLTLTMHEVPSPSDETICRFLNSVWKRYGRFTASQLSLLTHQPDTPWSDTWEKYKAKYIKGVDIPEELIRKHYEGLKAGNESRAAKSTTKR
jgi:uncharacterized phage-associated protein